MRGGRHLGGEARVRVPAGADLAVNPVLGGLKVPFKNRLCHKDAGAVRTFESVVVVREDRGQGLTL